MRNLYCGRESGRREGGKEKDGEEERGRGRKEEGGAERNAEFSPGGEEQKQTKFH